MVRHTVLFRLNGTPDEINRMAVEFQENIERLPALIPELESVEVHTDDGEVSDTNWHIVLTANCPDYTALEVYAKHPEHLKCVAIIKAAIAGRACVDYTF